ncbi:MAG: polysaccharide biosynthesis protein [Bryobacteraceae bacterium]|nr:polysaccharide biosynthesis protein [Bryobacteraceae bacterium]
MQHGLVSLWRLRTVLYLALLSALSMLGAFWLRFDLRLGREDWVQIAGALPLALACRLISFYYFRLDRRPLSTASYADLPPIVGSVAASSVLFGLFILVLLPELSFPRSVLLLDALLLTAFICGLYSWARLTTEAKRRQSPGARRVLVVGEGPAVLGVLRDVRASQQWLPVAVLTGDASRKGTELLGVRIAGPVSELGQVADKTGADLICFVNPGLGRKRLLELTSLCRREDRNYVLLRSRNAVRESAQSWVDDVSIEVILQREEVDINLTEVERFIQGRRILVTGAGGSIGSELSRQIASFRPESLYLLERSENNLFFIHREIRQLFPALKVVPLLMDITDQLTLDREFEAIRPEVVFHAAAFKHVGMMEDRPHEAIRNNVIGTATVARAASRAGAERFINVSTDKAVRPKSYMGLSKRLAEMAVQEMNQMASTSFVTVRFGNVAGSAGSVVQLFRQQIEQGGPVTVTDREARRFFMSIPEAVRLVLQAAVFGESGGIFVLEMGTPVVIHELARTMISLAGYIPDVDIPVVFTGLGAAEKMSEELQDDDEITEPTGHGRIHIIRKIKGGPRTSMLGKVERWRDLLKQGEIEQVMGELPEVWPATTQVRELPVRGAGSPVKVAELAVANGSPLAIKTIKRVPVTRN